MHECEIDSEMLSPAGHDFRINGYFEHVVTCNIKETFEIKNNSGMETVWRMTSPVRSTQT